MAPERTRQRIADAALELFVAHGYAAVTVAEVARAAGVTEKTVFNHFRAKADLVYGEDAAFETALLTGVRARPRGEPVAKAAQRFLLDRYRRFSLDPASRRRTGALARLVADSPELREHERRVHARYADALAALIAEEQRATPYDVRPRVAAAAVLAVHRESIAAVRRAVLAGAPDAEVANVAVTAARKGFALLDQGLGRYAARR
jgi:AcrR family transcriptional regulator